MRVHEKSLRRNELKLTIEFILVFIAMVTLGFLIHVLYFVMVFGVALAALLIAFGLIYRILVGESLLKLIIFHFRRDLR